MRKALLAAAVSVALVGLMAPTSAIAARPVATCSSGNEMTEHGVSFWAEGTNVRNATIFVTEGSQTPYGAADVVGRDFPRTTLVSGRPADTSLTVVFDFVRRGDVICSTTTTYTAPPPPETGTV